MQWPTLKALVFLRAIARELKRSNDLAQLRLSIEHPSEYKAKVVNRKGLKRRGEISQASIENWNEKYRQTHSEEERENPY